MTKNAQYVKAYQEREKAKRDAMGVKDVVLPLPASVAAMAAQVCKRDGFKSLTEMLITLIRVAHAGEPVVIPKSGFVPKQKHLAKIGAYVPCPECKDSGEQCEECES